MSRSTDSSIQNPFEDKLQPGYELSEIKSSETKVSSSSTVKNTEEKKSSNIALFVEKGDIPVLLLATVLICTSSVGAPLQTILFGKIFTKLSQFFAGEYSSVSHFISSVRLLCGEIIVVGALKMLFMWAGIFVWMKFGELQQSRARFKVFRVLVSKEFEWYDKSENLMGNISQVNRSIEELRSGTSEVIGLLVQTIASVIALFVTAMYHSWLLTIVLMAGSPVMALLGWYFGGLTYKAAKLENEVSSQASKVLDWSIVSGSIVRILGAKYTEIVKFNKIVLLSARAYYKLANAIAANGALLKTLALMMFVQGFWFGNHMIKAGKLEINQVFTCFSSCLMLGVEVANLNHVLATLNKAHAAVQIIDKIISENREVCEQELLQPVFCQGQIKFKNVDFKYPSRDSLVLQAVSFSIRSHEMNFIIGGSGSGKSTISQLLMKFYQPTQGSISLDGIDLKQVDRKWLSNNVTLVQQSSVIFKESVKDNIALAVASKFDSLEDVPELLISEACSFALLDDIIEGLEDNWDTIVGQDKLSGGQNQRIALARAKIRNSPILILDEALSALDSRRAEALFNSIRSWRKDRTTIIITHTLSQIGSRDHVVVMENGLVKNEGYFEDIQEQDNPMKHIIQKQPNPSSTFQSSIEEEDESKVNYLSNPAILQNLESSGSKGQEKKDEKLMSIFAILRYSSRSIDSKWLIFCGLAAAVLEGIAAPVFSFCFSKLLNNMVETSIGKDVSSALLKWSLIVLAIAIASGVGHYTSQFILAYCSENWIVNLRREAFAKISEQDMGFFDQEMTAAKLTTLIMNDTRDLRALVSQFLSLSVNLITLVLVGTIWAIISGWKLALVGISFVPLILLITGVYGRLLAGSENNYKSKVLDVESHVHDTVSGIRTVIGLGLREYFIRKFSTKMGRVKSAGTVRAIHTGFGLALSEVCTAAATGTILYYGMVLVGDREYTSDKLLQVITLLTFTMASAGGLLQQLPEISRGQKAGTFVIKLMDLSPSPIENEGTLKPLKLSNINFIEFKNVQFAYPTRPGDLILKCVSFSINKGGVLGILGESGSGKSTIGAVLTRLYGINGGNICMAGNDIRQLNIDWLREKVTVVPQNPTFFQGSIYENLLYGLSPRVKTDEEINFILKLVNIYSFVISLPEGIHTSIGEGANSLISGGQLQRLAIARALIRGPELLVLDECTSNLDPENTRIITELIHQKLRGRYTIILITHDPELMRISEKIVLLKRGRVVEEGSYLDLKTAEGELSRITNN